MLPSFPKELLRRLSVKGAAVGILRLEDGYAVRLIEKAADKSEIKTTLQQRTS
ncbi:MAG: hypothetical protein QW172_05080 [Candidatus Bathyarchaeia archaeon]